MAKSLEAFAIMETSASLNLQVKELFQAVAIQLVKTFGLEKRNKEQEFKLMNKEKEESDKIGKKDKRCSC